MTPFLGSSLIRDFSVVYRRDGCVRLTLARLLEGCVDNLLLSTENGDYLYPADSERGRPAGFDDDAGPAPTEEPKPAPKNGRKKAKKGKESKATPKAKKKKTRKS